MCCLCSCPGHCRPTPEAGREGGIKAVEFKACRASWAAGECSTAPLRCPKPSPLHPQPPPSPPQPSRHQASPGPAPYPPHATAHLLPGGSVGCPPCRLTRSQLPSQCLSSATVDCRAGRGTGGARQVRRSDSRSGQVGQGRSARCVLRREQPKGKQGQPVLEQRRLQDGKGAWGTGSQNSR